MKSNPFTLILAALALTVALVTMPAAAAGPTPEQRTEFNKLIQQRNRLSVHLHRLDRQAADQIKLGREPVVIHAEQVSAQDQIDLLELRLAILSTRHGLAVPPGPTADQAVEAGAGSGADARIVRAFSRGRARAMDDLERQTLSLLARIDFTKFLRE